LDSKTALYIVKRLFLAVFTVFLVITITFFVMHAVPGGPFTSEKAVTPEVEAALKAKYGLDKPLFEQYITYVGDAFTLNFGPSIKMRGRDVIDIIGDGLKTSAKLGVSAAFIALVIGVSLGAAAGYFGGKTDKVVIWLYSTFASMPGLLFILAFSLLFGKGFLAPEIQQTQHRTRSRKSPRRRL
jgi:oligopeptide transport system permease protein